MVPKTDKSKRPSAAEQISAVVSGSSPQELVTGLTQETTQALEAASEAVVYRAKLLPERTYYRVSDGTEAEKFKGEAETLADFLMTEYSGIKPLGSLFEIVQDDTAIKVYPGAHFGPIFQDHDSAAGFLESLEEHLEMAHQKAGGEERAAGFEGYVEEFKLFGEDDNG